MFFALEKFFGLFHTMKWREIFSPIKTVPRVPEQSTFATFALFTHKCHFTHILQRSYLKSKKKNFPCHFVQSNLNLPHNVTRYWLEGALMIFYASNKVRKRSLLHRKWTKISLDSFMCFDRFRPKIPEKSKYTHATQLFLYTPMQTDPQMTLWPNKALCLRPKKKHDF